MITALEFIQGGLKQLHGNLDKQLDHITADQLHAVPSGNAKANTIAWGLWHYARTDDIMRFGLHEYLTEFLEHISRLGNEVSKVFLVPTY